MICELHRWGEEVKGVHLVQITSLTPEMTCISLTQNGGRMCRRLRLVSLSGSLRRANGIPVSNEVFRPLKKDNGHFVKSLIPDRGDIECRDGSRKLLRSRVEDVIPGRGA